MPAAKESTATSHDRQKKIESAFPLAVSKSHRAVRVALWGLAAVAASAAAACALVHFPREDHRGAVPTAPVAASGAFGGSSAWKGVDHGATETPGSSGVRLRQGNGAQAATAGPTRWRASGEVDEDVGAAAAERRSSSPTMDNSRSRELRIFRNATSLDFSESWEGGPVGGPVGFPALGESTLMFLHVFKCAGSTLRRMLVEWAEVSGNRGAVVHRCDYIKPGEICLHHYELIDRAAQVQQISQLKVLAGHFLWGFQEHVKGPYLMITALRSPLEVWVSGRQYLHKKKTKTPDKAHEFIADAMSRALLNREPGMPAWTSDGVDVRDHPDRQIGGFVRRFVGVDKGELVEEGLVAATTQAKRNLETFWLVGVVEQYSGFEEVLRRCLDPSSEYRELWQKYASNLYNTSPVGTRDVLRAIDSDLVHRFNRSLALQWEVYEKAASLWDVRCREVLPATMHEKMCTVPPAPEMYR